MAAIDNTRGPRGAAVVVRPARRADATTLARMANRLNREEGLDDRVHNEAGMADALFGPRPVCHGLIAEREGEVAGYALFSETYNTDLAARGLWLIDFFVAETARRRGVGRALAVALAQEAKARGAKSMWGAVRAGNRAARAFYAAMDARDDDVRLLELDGEGLDALAAPPDA